MRKSILVCLCAILLGTAAPAFANSPSQGAYGGTGNNQLSQVQGDTSNQAASTSSSTLPFTGLSLPVLAGIAVVLLATGVTLRIRTRTDS